jgi:hypothetical protein
MNMVMNEFSDKLLTIFQNVNDWLKFAEAKNAALLAFSGTGLTATLTVLATAQGLPNSLRAGLFVSTCLLGICALLCALSFLPKTNLEKLLWIRNKPSRTSRPKAVDNFYYFGDLQKYSEAELLDSLNTHYFNNSITSPYGKECSDLAAQITVNSGIASMKFQFFTYALYCLIISIIAVPILALISLLTFRGF